MERRFDGRGVVFPHHRGRGGRRDPRGGAYRGKGGFGSAKVTATIGETGWRTSVFPHKASGGWLLPVKKAVRQAEGLNEGDRVRVRLTL